MWDKCQYLLRSSSLQLCAFNFRGQLTANYSLSGADNTLADSLGVVKNEKSAAFQSQSRFTPISCLVTLNAGIKFCRLVEVEGREKT